MGSKSSKVIKTKQRSLSNSIAMISSEESTVVVDQYALSSIYSDPFHVFSASPKKFIHVNSFMKREGRQVEVKEFIGGSQHLFVWLEDDPYENFIPDHEKYIVSVKHNLYGLLENDYGQCSELSTSKKVLLDLKEGDFIASVKKDKEKLKKASKQVWTLKNVITLCNYSFFHIITRGEYNLELVLGCGWNNAGCCSVGDFSANSISTAKPVVFDIGGNHTVFLPEGQEISFICAGGCNSLIISKDMVTNQQFVYVSGETSRHINNDNVSYSFFTHNKNVSQDIGTERFIKKAISAYGSTHFLLSDGTLLTYGNYPLNASGSHKVDPSNIRGETISDVICYENLFAILTREGNVWVASDSRTLTVSEFGPGTIVQMIPSLQFNAIALRTREDEILLISDRDFENNKTLSEKLLQHLTLDSFITHMGLTNNQEDESKLRTLARLTQRQEYSISIHCLHNFILAFKPNQKKNAAKRRMLEKLKEELLSPTNPFKDITFV